MELISINKLKTVNSLEKIQALNSLGIYSIRDMAEYEPCRHAELIIAYDQKHMLEELDLENYIEVPVDAAYLLSIANASIKDLIAITDEFYEIFKSVFTIESIQALSVFAPYLEAREIIRKNLLGDFYEKPSAPDALLPKMIGTTHTQVKFSNYVREKEIILNEYDLTYYPDNDEPDPADALINIFYQSSLRFYLGYLGSVQQKWISTGMHLGEPIHTIALAPGESRNFAVIDWHRRQQSSRNEDTTIDERLTSEFVQTRALNEVVQSTANEHLVGGTEIDSSTKTTGYGLVGGVGGGAAKGNVSTSEGSSSLFGPMFGMLLGATGSGSAGQGIISSIAGSLGGSLVHSKGSLQGTLKSETHGERQVMGEVVQNITDSTVQNSANVRSIMSTVVVEDRQSGRQRAQTRNITNYNHSHVLNMVYFELLETYRIRTGVDALMPVLFLPFKPINFNIELIKDYWYLFGKAIKQSHPKKFIQYDQIVKDFDPNNDAFDISGNVRIDSIKIVRTKSFTADVRVELTKADPSLTLAIAGADLSDSLELIFSGAATYIDYEVLGESSSSFNQFGSVDSFEIDENIVAKIKSDFKPTLVKTMKGYLNDNNKTPKRGEFGRDDNDLAARHNRDNLIQQVEDGDYRLLNGNEKVELSLSIEYNLRDENNQSLTLNQSVVVAYTFSELHSGMEREITNVSDFINTQLTTVTDVNPADVIEEIENHFTFHKYGYTKYLLAHIEKEQVIDIIEHLGVSGGGDIISLSSLIDPNPLAITENLLIFKLKNQQGQENNLLGERYTSIIHSSIFEHIDKMGGSGFKKPVMRDGRNTMMYQISTQEIQAGKGSPKAPAYSSEMVLYIDKKSIEKGKYPLQGHLKLRTLEKGITREKPISISGTATQAEGNKIKASYKIDSIYGDLTSEDIRGELDISLEYPPVDSKSVSDIIIKYQQSVNQYEEQMRSRPKWTTVYLPTTGVFGEAILGVSNSSEYINPRRFFHWQDSLIPNRAPDIQSVNANQDYVQPVGESINPTVPVSVLNQILPQSMPSTSLGSALEAIQNGNMFRDMSKTEHLTGVLGTLAQLASTTAQLSGNLAGTAGSNALTAAVELGKQVASMIGTAMGSNVASPPQSPLDKGMALAILDALSPTPTPKEKAEAGVGGVQIPSGNGSVNDPSNNSNNGNNNGGGNGNNGGGNSNNGNENGGTNSGIPSSGTPTTFSQVEMTISSLNITGGQRFSENVLELLSTFTSLIQLGELPTWMAPENFELFRPYSTMEITGIMQLKSASGIVVEQKNFTIRSTDALGILKNRESFVLDKFNPYLINLIKPIKKLKDLDGNQTITAFSNVDPLSVVDVLVSTLLWPVSVGGLTGLDEINFGSGVLSIAEYSALVSNAVFGRNGYSQFIEHFTNLRENWTQSGLAIYINNSSKNRFDYINPVNVLEDICIAIPTSPPDLIIS